MAVSSPQSSLPTKAAPAAVSPKAEAKKEAASSPAATASAPAAAPAAAASPATAAAISSPAPAAPAPAPAPAAAKPAVSEASTPVPTAAAAVPAASPPVAKLEPLPMEPDGIINMEIFSQIQDMDDDDDDDGDGGGHEFSKGIVWGYFEQAENTFKQMQDAIAEPSLSKLSSLGHFLKGSSAALGIIKVQNSCEKMQHYGNLRDEEVDAPLTEDEALKRISQLLVDCKRDYAVASRWLRRLYGEEDSA